MNELCLHPQVYDTGGNDSLLRMLEDVWVRGLTTGDGTICLVSGFANYNGGLRFYDVFKKHVAAGGRAWAVIGGSTRQALSSRQAAEALLDSGVEVHVVNRKRILHAKCYGTRTQSGERLVVSSGNFTGPGMSQNVEMSLMLDADTTSKLGFSWDELERKILAQRWQISRVTADKSDPVWRLLYDERPGAITLDETEEVTLLVTLSHADTARVNAKPGTDEGKGTQYFWLSRDCFAFFPPLTITNRRGTKRTFSCLVSLDYVDLNVVDNKCRVTFEAENNLDFRLGTAPLRYQGVAAEGDMVAISRTGDATYQLRIFRKGSAEYKTLDPYAPTFIGHQGKRYGFVPNEDFERLVGVRLPSIRLPGERPGPVEG